MGVATSRKVVFARVRFLAAALFAAFSVWHARPASAAENPGEALQRQFASAKSALAAGNLSRAEDNYRQTIALALRQLGNLSISELQFDQASGKVHIAGQIVELRLSERRLLALLMRQAGSIVAKTTLEDALSGFGRELTSNAVEVLVSRLRKVVDGAQAGLVIETVRGAGYLLRHTTQ